MATACCKRVVRIIRAFDHIGGADIAVSFLVFRRDVGGREGFVQVCHQQIWAVGGHGQGDFHLFDECGFAACFVVSSILH